MSGQNRSFSTAMSILFAILLLVLGLGAAVLNLSNKYEHLLHLRDIRIEQLESEISRS